MQLGTFVEKLKEGVITYLRMYGEMLTLWGLLGPNPKLICKGLLEHFCKPLLEKYFPSPSSSANSYRKMAARGPSSSMSLSTKMLTYLLAIQIVFATIGLTDGQVIRNNFINEFDEPHVLDNGENWRQGLTVQQQQPVHLFEPPTTAIESFALKS